MRDHWSIPTRFPNEYKINAVLSRCPMVQYTHPGAMVPYSQIIRIYKRRIRRTEVASLVSFHINRHV